jgi:hypothetical protein
VFEIVACVVLAQGAQALPDPAVGQNDLQAEHLLARAAIAKHVYSARVGGKIASDEAAAFRGKRERKQAVCFLCRFLYGGKDASGLHGHRVVQRIELANSIHARKREHDLPRGTRGHAAAAQPGVSALGNDGCFFARAQCHDPGHLLGATGANDALGARRVLLSPVGKVRRSVMRIGQHMGGAHDVGKGSGQTHGAGLSHHRNYNAGRHREDCPW